MRPVQQTLFSQKVLGQQTRKPRKVWQSWEIIPFGRFKGKTLKYMATNHPNYMLWWRQKSKLSFSDEVDRLIKISLFILK